MNMFPSNLGTIPLQIIGFSKTSTKIIQQQSKSFRMFTQGAKIFQSMSGEIQDPQARANVIIFFSVGSWCEKPAGLTFGYCEVW